MRDNHNAADYPSRQEPPKSLHDNLNGIFQSIEHINQHFSFWFLAQTANKIRNKCSDPTKKALLKVITNYNRPKYDNLVQRFDKARDDIISQLLQICFTPTLGLTLLNCKFGRLQQFGHGLRQKNPHFSYRNLTNTPSTSQSF